MGNHTMRRGNGGARRIPGVIIALVLTALAIGMGLAVFNQPFPDIWKSPMQMQRSGDVVRTTTAMTPEMQEAEREVSALVAPYAESVAVAVVSLGEGGGFSINGDERFVSASMIKLLILAEYMQQVDAGMLDPDGIHVLDESDMVGGAGVVAGSSSGATFTYDELACHMIKYSDNTAANILIDTLGMEAINHRASALGLAQTELQRKMMHFDGDAENYISANDAAALLCGIAQHGLASDSTSEVAESYLLEQADSEGLVAGLPSSVRFGHKTGALDSVRHDGGIVYGESPYVIVVLTSLDEAKANSLMEEISRMVYEALE